MATKKRDSRLPKKGRLRQIADRLWSLAVREDWNHRCAMCGAGNCEAHHLLPRQLYGARYMLENGIALCAACHQWDANRSPHQNAEGWVAWLKNHKPKTYQWYVGANAGRLGEFQGTKTDDFYVAQILELRQYVKPEQFTEVVGVRFGDYLEEKLEDYTC